MRRFIPIRILTAIFSIAAALASVSSRAAITVGATVIGSEANVTPPPSSAWNYLVTIRPGNHETVTVNPPLFSWLYAPGSPLNSSVDQNVYFFQFQADYDGSFTHPVVNVRTPSCCYNFLAPFSQSTVHWRVGYVTSAGVTNTWITNSFTIAPNATNWDRSMLANPSYLAGKAAHPHLIFNSANRAAVSKAYVQTNNPSYWLGVTNLALQGMASSYWTNPVPWPQKPNAFTSPGVDTAANQIASAAFAWQMTGNPLWTNGVATNFDNMVNCFVAAGSLGKAGLETDYGDSGGDNTWIRSIAYSALRLALPDSDAV